MDEIQLRGKRFYLGIYTSSKISSKYLGWLEDPQVNQFITGLNAVKPTMENVKEYLKSYDNTEKSFFFGIYDKEKDIHIGTASLRLEIDKKTSYFGYLIGEKDYWGVAGMEACSILLDFAFLKLNLRKIWGGVYEKNTSSLFNFMKLGFMKEGHLRKHIEINGVPQDSLIFGIFKDEWLKKRKQLDY